MLRESLNKSGPLVSVLMSSYNRPRYICEAIQSVLRQTYTNFEMIIVRDGGAELRGIVDSFGDRRLILIDRDQNRGKPYSLNEAIKLACGKYVCYLDDDDMYYPNHIAVLVEALESQDECGVAYSDLYKSHCRVMPDGKRVVLSKNVEVSRDFNRIVMLQFNHVLHVSVMHRRDLLDKTGPYNEDLNVMIDWDMTRKLTFFSDFIHVHEVTGEFYGPIGDCDRISIERRKNVNDYIRNLLTIRSTRPAKPWAKMNDLSVILLADRLNERVEELLRDIWSHSFYPYEVYLPLPAEDLERLSTVVPNIIGVPVSAESSPAERVDAAFECCQGDYVAIVPDNFKIVPAEAAWIEKSLKPLMESEDPNQAFEVKGSSKDCRATVFGREQFGRARRMYGHLPIAESIDAAGIKLRKPVIEEFPFQFDNAIACTEEIEAAGEWKRASKIFEYLRDNYQNELWMNTRCANALYHAGKYSRAVEVASKLNRLRPTVATLLIEARAHHKKNEFESAINLLTQAEDILEGSELGSLTV